jgi:hypothetical protein
MLYGCLGQRGRGLWDSIRSRGNLVASQEENAGPSLEGLAFLGKAGM